MHAQLSELIPKWWKVAGMALLLLAMPAPAADQGTDKELQPAQLGGMEIEDLMKIRVTSVSKKEESMANAAASIFVLNQEDIHRSGFNSIPEALRMVPGLEVARLDAHDWAITSRGFNDVFANKLLVLIDGRSVYTPLFSGVFWDVQDTLLDDLDRIEVIRGPGATVWGANAVNGVINIITKSARDTQGTVLMAGAGSEERVFGGFRYGGTAGTNLFYRVYGKYFDKDDSVLETGERAFDSWNMGRGGFRLDWDATTENRVTFQGDFYGGQEHQVFIIPTATPPFSSSTQDRVHLSGGNVLGRWTHTYAEDSDLQLQLYYDRTYRDSVIFKEDRSTYDVDLQHRFPLGSRNDIVWGAGYRASSDELGNTPTVAHFPPSRTVQLFSSFVQDEIGLIPEKLSLVLGSKFEHNDFTGFEVQPSGRLLWRPVERHTLWGSISRAVRTPSRAEDDIQLTQQILPSALPTTILGNRAFESEKLLAYELGYRAEPHQRCFFDLSVFYNAYDDLRSLEPGTPTTVIPLTVNNLLEGETYGGSMAMTWRPMDWWRVRPSYTYLQMQLRRKPGSLDPLSESAEGAIPNHQCALFSSMDLLASLAFDSNLRFVDELPTRQTPSYWELDLRLGWKPLKNLELSIAGQNLLHAHHVEFNRSFINNPRTEVEREVYGKVTWRF